ncbi:MAG: beta-galactosidase, partial [Candidatus Solibacter sp.]|nr:beta-galactosidase [Candidatus Solibacter sp.]
MRPKDTGAALVNPGMGWQFHHYDNNIRNYGLNLEPSDTVDEFPGVSSVYLRLAWSFIEPQEGKFNWSIVDTPAARWIAKGKQVAFRFTCSEGTPYATPEWVRKAGAKGYLHSGKGVLAEGRTWEPDFDDPIFLDKLDHFLAAAAARYDGSPDVAFIDVASFGIWGEGHTYASTLLPYSAATVRRHIDLHKKNFKRTLIVANDDFANQGRGLEAIEYARQMGLALRDDSILVQGGERAYLHAYLAPLFWPQTPVILESEHYGGSKKRGAWGDGSLYLQAIEDYHASYATVHWYPREFLQECRPLIDKINLRLGYRLQLQEASWPAEVRRNEPLTVGYRWR